MSDHAQAAVVSLKGNLTVDKAASLKDELGKALAESSAVFVDLSSAEDIDLSCLQALYSAAAGALDGGGRLGFAGKLPARISQRLFACGFVGERLESAEGLERKLAGFPGSGA